MPGNGHSYCESLWFLKLFGKIFRYLGWDPLFEGMIPKIPGVNEWVAGRWPKYVKEPMGPWTILAMAFAFHTIVQWNADGTTLETHRELAPEITRFVEDIVANRTLIEMSKERASLSDVINNLHPNLDPLRRPPGSAGEAAAV